MKKIKKVKSVKKHHPFIPENDFIIITGGGLLILIFIWIFLAR
ncbi:MAG TPA: hypothetical protein VLG67_03255 [Candidatus Saccharimonadales bacterium]|nr:hypothetical protein [Candidatus Saccharimonadales bacterium]